MEKLGMLKYEATEREKMFEVAILWGSSPFWDRLKTAYSIVLGRKILYFFPFSRGTGLNRLNQILRSLSLKNGNSGKLNLFFLSPEREGVE